MLVIGLTGSIGMGKSTVARRFLDNGVDVFDADAVVHDLYEGEAVEEIEAAFPGSSRDGKIDRTLLSQQLKKDTGALARLEAIVHPMVREKREKFFSRHSPCPALEGGERNQIAQPNAFARGNSGGAFRDADFRS